MADELFGIPRVEKRIDEAGSRFMDLARRVAILESVVFAEHDPEEVEREDAPVPPPEDPSDLVARVTGRSRGRPRW